MNTEARRTLRKARAGPQRHDEHYEGQGRSSLPFSAPPCLRVLTAALLCVVLALPALAGAADVAGVVFWDADGDGARGPGEAGVPGVRVNANHTAAVTDDDGAYRIVSAEPIITVALSFPSGTWPTDGWFRRVDAAGQGAVDFGLQRQEQELPFMFIQFTDPHGLQDMALQKIAAECADLPIKPSLLICTGDVRSGYPTVRDVPDLEQSYIRIDRMFEVAGAPLFAVPGNHDTVDFRWGGEPVTDEDTRHGLFGNRAWERYVCPSHWSFSYAGVHFIGVEYAQFVDGAWDTLSPATRRWVASGRTTTENA